MSLSLTYLRKYYLNLYETLTITSDTVNSLSFSTLEEHVQYILSSLKKNVKGQIVINKQTLKLLNHLKFLYRVKLFFNQSILTDFELKNKNLFYHIKP